MMNFFSIMVGPLAAVRLEFNSRRGSLHAYRCARQPAAPRSFSRARPSAAERQRLSEEAGIAARNARAAARADFDLDHALRVQGSQRVARDDAADGETLREILFRAEEIARPKLLCEQRLAHLGDDLRGHGRAAKGNHVSSAALDSRMKPHAKLRDP